MAHKQSTHRASAGAHRQHLQLSVESARTLHSALAHACSLLTAGRCYVHHHAHAAPAPHHGRNRRGSPPHAPHQHCAPPRDRRWRLGLRRMMAPRGQLISLTCAAASRQEPPLDSPSHASVAGSVESGRVRRKLSSDQGSSFLRLTGVVLKSPLVVPLVKPRQGKQ